MLNQHQIIGHLGKDPEIRYAQSGAAIANFSIATTEKWKDKTTGDFQEQTEWHRCTAFDKLAEIIGQYVKKGSLIYVSGKSKTRKYTDKDGIERYSTEVTVSEMKMLGGKNDSQDRSETQRPAPRPASQPTRQAPAKAASFDDMDSDIPF